MIKSKMVEKVLLLINLLADLPFEDFHFVIDNAKKKQIKECQA